ncbi:suppressor of fused domain protein [Neisseria lactamica]|uniref:Suppressor of fused family protein n=1 Tax=Neisseria lactamica TaxID=486 RepID=A0AAU8VJF6_NEILA|nr:suppressor of fused domain protein [Neisseria lactamica]ARB05333.1 suppressor of fused family protein [Neisseria lactamica]
MDYNQTVLSHLQNFWKHHEIKGFTWALGRIVEELPDFQVFQVIPNHEDEPWVYVSSGIGSFLGQEFFIVSPFETPEHIETLAMLASASMHYPDRFQLGKIVNIGRPWVGQSSFWHFLISLPYPYGQELEYMDNVRFFWLLPITRQERLFLDTHSVEELETKFDKAGIDYLDINRASTVWQAG